MDEKAKRILNDKVYPKYILTGDGYVGVFAYFDFGEFPVYRFEGGCRVADNVEIQNGSDDREELVNR